MWLKFKSDLTLNLRLTPAPKINITYNEPTSIKMKKLRKLYEELLDAKEYINKTYSSFLTVRISYLFLELVYCLFLNIIQFQFRQNSKFKGTLPEVLITVYPITLLADFLSLAISGELLSRQGKKTPVIVHRLITQMSDNLAISEV